MLTVELSFQSPAKWTVNIYNVTFHFSTPYPRIHKVTRKNHHVNKNMNTLKLSVLILVFNLYF